MDWTPLICITFEFTNCTVQLLSLDSLSSPV